MTLVLSACGGNRGSGELDDLRLVGIDFELDSIVLTNTGTEVVRTQDLWVYQNGESSRFNVFLIEPRTEILFSVRDIGGIDPSGGEIALFGSDSFSEPDALLEYVAWGGEGHSRIDVATDAGKWSDDGPVTTEDSTILIVRVDEILTGPAAWTSSEVLP